MKKIYILLYSVFLFNASLNADCIKALSDSDYPDGTTVNKGSYAGTSVLSDSSFPEVGYYLTSTNLFYRSSQWHNGDSTSGAHDAYYYNYSDIGCSCPSGQEFDASGVCVVPPCPDEDTVLPRSESDCHDSYTWVHDGGGETYADLYYQSCDNTCRGTVLKTLTCDDLGLMYFNQCDRSKNDFNFACNNDTNKIDDTNTYCKPKTNPCDALYDNVAETCQDPDKLVVGYPECTHNGTTVTNDTIKCVDKNSSENPANQKQWDCVSYFHQTWNDTSKICECESGYFRSSYGSCQLDLDSNATQEQKDSANNDAKNDAQKKDELDQDRNASLETNHHLGNIEDTLANISNDVNQSKSLLGGIKSSIDGLSSKLDANSSDLPSMDMTSNFDSLKSNYSDIYSSIDELKTILSNGLVNSIPSGSGNTCAYTNTITGNGMTIPVSFDPCTVVKPYYTTLYNIWYFLFFVGFLALSIKLLIFSKGE